MTAHFNYKDALARAEVVNWRVEDLIGGDKTLDFAKPFLPESLARVEELTFLSDREKLILNQIRGHGYLYMFGLVEEFILPFVLDHAEAGLSGGDDYRIRALLQFASEEAKHIHLFKRFREEFIAGFGTQCDVIGPPEAVAEEVLKHDPLAVSFAVLGIEWMTQAHYTESVREDDDLDPQFKSLLKHHWMEEMQHAQIDTLVTEAIAESADAARRLSAVDEYLEIGAFLDAGLKQQTEFDCDAFERASERRLSASERKSFVEAQHQAMRWTFLGSGLTHPQVIATIKSLTPEGAQKIANVAPAFC
ncbi:MAG: hypothetical protein AAFW81_03120 [Pseudomonadota bacterium]